MPLKTYTVVAKAVAQAPQWPTGALVPQKVYSFTEMLSVLGCRTIFTGPSGERLGSVVWVITPAAAPPDPEVSCPVALSPGMISLPRSVSHGGGTCPHTR